MNDSDLLALVEEAVGVRLGESLEEFFEKRGFMIEIWHNLKYSGILVFEVDSIRRREYGGLRKDITPIVMAVKHVLEGWED